MFAYGKPNLGNITMLLRKIANSFTVITASLWISASLSAQTPGSSASSPIKVELLRLQKSIESQTNVENCQAFFRVYNNTDHDIAFTLTVTPQDLLGYRLDPITELVSVEDSVGKGEIDFELIPAGRDRQNAMTMRGISCEPAYMQLAVDADCQNLVTQSPCTESMDLLSRARDDIGAPRPLVVNGYRYDPKHLNRQVVQLLMMRPEVAEKLELAMISGTPLHEPPKSNIIIDVENEETDIIINGSGSSDGNGGEEFYDDMPYEEINEGEYPYGVIDEDDFIIIE